MSFVSGLKAFGHGIEKIFGWMTSPKGVAVIQAGEAVVETILPNSIPIVNLFNEWAKKAFMVESLAVSASQAQGSGADKAALAIQSITPQVLQYAQEQGLGARTAQQIQDANDAVVKFINAMTQPNA